MTGLVIKDMKYGHLHEVMDIEFTSFSTPWTEKSFRYEMENPNSAIKVAVWEGEVVGYTVAYTVMDEGHIMNLATRFDMRRRGIGKTLVVALLEELKGRGLKSVYLEVRESNHPAKKLYESLGFRVACLRKDYYQIPREDAVVMRLEL